MKTPTLVLKMSVLDNPLPPDCGYLLWTAPYYICHILQHLVAYSIFQACYSLTGYRIDTSSDSKFKLVSMYAESESDYLLFQVF